MEWWIILIGLAVILVVSKFIHFRHIKHRITAIIFILIILFLVLTFTSVTKNNDINIKTPAGVFSAGKIYFVWLGHALNNVKVITLNAIRMDWLPQPQGNSTSGITGLATEDTNTNNNANSGGWKVP